MEPISGPVTRPWTCGPLGRIYYYYFANIKVLIRRLMTSHCTYKLVIKEVPFCSRWQWTQRPTTSQHAGMSDCGVLGPKWDITPSPKVWDHCRNRLQRLSQRQQTTISTLFSRYSGAAELHLWTHSDCESMHKATHSFKPDKDPAWGWWDTVNWLRGGRQLLCFGLVCFFKGVAPDWFNIFMDGHKSKSKTQL